MSNKNLKFNEIPEYILGDYNITKFKSIDEIFDFLIDEDCTKEDLISMLSDKMKKEIILANGNVVEDNDIFYYSDSIYEFETDYEDGKLENINEEIFYKRICDKYVNTRGEHYIVEDNDGIHYLELNDEYDDVNRKNYKALLKDGEDTLFETYKDLYKGIVEYNIYDDLENSKKYGYTINNFYLDKEDLDMLGIKVILQLDETENNIEGM